MKKTDYIMMILAMVMVSIIYLSTRPIPAGVIVAGDVAIFLLGWWATWVIRTIK